MAFCLEQMPMEWNMMLKLTERVKEISVQTDNKEVL